MINNTKKEKKLKDGNEIFDLGTVSIYNTKDFFFPINPFREKVIAFDEDLAKNMNEIIFSSVNSCINININYEEEILKSYAKSILLKNKELNKSTFNYKEIEEKIKKDYFNKNVNPLEYKNLHELNEGFNLNMILEVAKNFSFPTIILINKIEVKNVLKGETPFFESIVVYKYSNATLKRIKEYIENHQIRKNPDYIKREEYKKYLYTITNEEIEDKCFTQGDYKTRKYITKRGDNGKEVMELFGVEIY